MKTNPTKTMYLRGEGETLKDVARREEKITRVVKKMGRGATQSAAMRLMIDSYKE